MHGLKMALAYRKSDRDDQAVEPLLKVDRSNKQLFTSARLLAAQTLRKTQKWQEIVDLVNYALEDTSSIDNNYRMSQLYIMRGTSQKNLNKFDEAIADYTAAYNLNQPETQEMSSVYRAGVYI